MQLSLGIWGEVSSKVIMGGTDAAEPGYSKVIMGGQMQLSLGIWGRFIPKVIMGGQKQLRMRFIPRLLWGDGSS